MSKKPIRILIASFAYTPLVGGAEIAVREITDRIDPSDIAFDMVTVRTAGLPRCERIGNITVHRVGFLPHGEGALSRLIRGMAKLLFVKLACWKMLRLHYKHRYDAVWSIMAAFAGFAALFFKLLHPSVPFILTLQEGIPLEEIRRRVRFGRPLFRMLFRKANVVQAISNYLARFAKEEGAVENPVVIGNGVAVEHFSAPIDPAQRAVIRGLWQAAVGDTILFTASRLAYKNAIDICIQSLTHSAPSVRLVIAGEGPLRASLQELVDRLHLSSRVRFIGTVSHEELPLFLQSADVFVRPSRSEGFGNSFVEAMAAGVPVIATNAGGIPDFLTDEETGLVVPIDDEKALAQAVERLSADGELRTRIVAQARQMVAKRYDWGTIANRMKEEVFAKAIKH